MYFSYGWPRALATGCRAGEAVHISLGPDYLVIVFAGAIQIWTGGQHRIKVGELVRSQASLQEEGAHIKAYWCPGRKCLAALTDNNHLLYYGVLSSKEAIWRFPDGREVKRASVYLQNSLHLDYGAAARVVDLVGDAKAVVAVLSSGALQVFSWQGQLWGQSNPFTMALEGSRSGRMQRARSSAAASAPNLARVSSASCSSGSLQAGPAHAASGTLDGGAAALGAYPNGSLPPLAVAARSAVAQSGALDSALSSLPVDNLPTPTSPREVVVRSVHWAPAARLLALVLEDGRCALCRTPEAGMQPVEQVHFLRWVYVPNSPSVAAVSVAINPSSQLLALGLAHGRVALFTLQSLLTLRRNSTAGSGQGFSTGGAAAATGVAAAGSRAVSGAGGAAAAAAAGGAAGLPDPLRVLSLTDWGWSSTITGAAAVMQWSPDGRVLAVGYGRRGMAVWTPSGCRLMCSLRQAAPAAAPLSAALQPGVQGVHGGAATPRHPGGAEQPQTQFQAQGPEPSGSSPSSPLGRGNGKNVLSHPSLLNPQVVAAEVGVLEDSLSALCWGPQGYQLLVAERGSGEAARILEQDFARFVAGQHRTAPQHAATGHGHGGARHAHGGVTAAAAAAASGAAADAVPSWPAALRGQQSVHALQAADRILIITENQPTLNAALAVPAGLAGGEASQRPDLSLQHVRVPQQYIESNYPVMLAAISQDRGDVAVAGVRGLAVYARRAQRWRMFGDVTQERQLRVQRLAWLPGGVVAACAYVDSKEAGGASQLLLYPRHHLDNASLLARSPLNQMPAALDSAGSCLLLAFAPLELRVVRVEMERGPVGGRSSGGGGGGAAGGQGALTARLTTLRELSIMSLASPLQEIALVDPLTWQVGAPSGATLAAAGSDEQPSAEQQAQQQGQHEAQQAQQQAQDLAAALPQLRVATKPALPPPGPPGDPMHCVLLRAGGVLSLLNMDEGTEQVLSDEVERFWLPSAPAAAPLAPADAPGPAAEVGATPQGAPWGVGSEPRGAPLSRENSVASSLPLPAHEASGSLAANLLAGAGGSGRWSVRDDIDAASSALGATTWGQAHVEMPWWTHGARGMQLWFPSMLCDPATPLGRGASGAMLSPTSGAAAGTAGAAGGRPPANSTDPELEFDREVYPIGVSLAEVSIIGVTQRTVRSSAFPPTAPQSLCFHPLPESQPVLPCLLRRLLQKGRLADAVELARLHSTGPHFSRSLEWLLFTALELDSEQQREAAVYGGSSGSGSAKQQRVEGSPYSPRSSGPATKRLARAGPLLMAAAQLVQQFPQYAELVVSVARKTDAQLWPSLFAAVGSPARLGEGLRAAGDLQRAACCLLLVDHIEGTAQAHALALRLIRAALRAGEYELVADLLRFLLPPGESEALLASLPLEGSAAAAAKPQQQQRRQQQQQAAAGGGYTSWLWGMFGGGGGSSAAAPAPAGGSAGGGGEAAEGEAEFSFTPVMDACRLMARHAWKLLDSGALRQLVSMSAAASSLPGGLGTLLASCTQDLPLAQPHLQLSASGVASALFVALNEFPTLDSNLEAVAEAEALLAACSAAGCANHAAALALLLCDEDRVQALQRDHPAVAQELASLLAGDAYLCSFARLLQPGDGEQGDVTGEQQPQPQGPGREGEGEGGAAAAAAAGGEPAVPQQQGSAGVLAER